ncbi:MAG TPA: hypothetical protein VHC86_16135 [Opitutaceae bacterium]|nr:hypothetical protein [Opitutaceae bacterium]
MPRPPADEIPIPERIELPPALWRHYRSFAWVVHEQRLMLLLIAVVLAATGMVWLLAWDLGRKPPLVVRAPPSLKESAAAFYGVPEISYDQMAFFLHGCLPLLYAADEEGHRFLPLVQGLVAPEIYSEAERRLAAGQPAAAANRLTQALTLTGIGEVVADARSRRAGAYVRGYLTVTLRHAEAEFFPWRGEVVLEVNPPGRLNASPFYLARLEERTGPAAPAWDRSHGEGRLLP